MQNRKAFSLVEIIITISITALLAVIGISAKQSIDEKAKNGKIISDIQTINNALISFSEETKTLPLPGGNTNFYGVDTNYKHSYDDPDTFGVYGSITEDTLAKKYLDVLPLDPRTNSYYSYGKTKATSEFEIASIQYVDSYPVSKVIGNYKANNGPYNLIREYNGPNFVIDNSTSTFPYNPEELVLIARVLETEGWKTYREGDPITTGPGEQKEIFFSDGSVSILEESSEVILNKLNFKGGDNLNTFVKIGLTAGTIWTRATKLNEESEFQIQTSDTVAAVRGTIFGISINSGVTEVTVLEGEVDVYKVTTDGEKGETISEIKVNENESLKNIRIDDSMINTEPFELSTTIPNFSRETKINNPEDDKSLNDPTSWEKQNEIPVSICSTFEIDGICQDTESTLEGYNLVAYAPYNEVGDLYLYSSSGTGIPKTNFIAASDNNGREYYKTSGEVSSANGDDLSLFGDVISSESSLVKAQNGEKGIVITPLGELKDYLTYDLSNLELGSDFAIEMSVNKEALMQEGGRYIFDNDYGKGLGISKVGDEYYLKYNSSYLCSDSLSETAPNCDFTFSNDFENIKIINGERISIGGKEFTITGLINISSLYIGSNKYSKMQLNGIINFVKIYIK